MTLLAPRTCLAAQTEQRCGDQNPPFHKARECSRGNLGISYEVRKFLGFLNGGYLLRFAIYANSI